MGERTWSPRVDFREASGDVSTDRMTVDSRGRPSRTRQTKRGEEKGEGVVPTTPPTQPLRGINKTPANELPYVCAGHKTIPYFAYQLARKMYSAGHPVEQRTVSRTGGAHGSTCLGPRRRAAAPFRNLFIRNLIGDREKRRISLVK